MRELNVCLFLILFIRLMRRSGVNNKRRACSGRRRVDLIIMHTCVVIRWPIIIHTSDAAPSSESLGVYFGAAAIAETASKNGEN